jgi:hypothetical protein
VAEEAVIREGLDYLRNACLTAGLPPARVLTGKTREDVYRVAPAALLLPLGGSLRRDGSRVGGAAHTTHRRLYGGSLRVRLELYARGPEELDRLLVGVLRYLWETPFRVGDDPHARLNEIALSYLDEEGALMTEHALALEVPLEVALYEDTPWVPVEVVVEEGGLEKEV